jgi:Protein kinase domain.
VYRVSQIIGTGTFGEIKTCFHRETGQKRAVKLFRRELLSSENEKVQLL